VPNINRGVSPGGLSPGAAALAFIGSARVASAITTVSITTALCAFAVRQIIGWPGLLAILVGLVVLAVICLVAHRAEISWLSVLPISLAVFAGWAVLTILWSQYQWATLGGLVYIGLFTILGVFIAMMRDTIQIVRAFGDSLRVVLVASLALEIFSGLLIDTRIGLLNIDGNLQEGGPIVGLLDTRNQLGMVAVIALITFGSELRTKSISRMLGIFSLTLATTLLLFTRSPVAFGSLLVALVAAAALYALRRVPAERRRFWQLGIAVAAVVIGAILWSFRPRMVELFNASGDLSYRLGVWEKVWDLIAVNFLEGWGWIGIWRGELQPFPVFASFTGRVPVSALNAFLDVWLQLGLVGLVIFVGMLGLTFTRSWLLASRRRSFVFTWPALVLVVLLVSALAESALIVEFGWLTFVVCCVRASQELSWRTALADMRDAAGDGNAVVETETSV
jgi:O-antigen ligase